MGHKKDIDLFISKYIETGNATASALFVGYSEKTAYSQGARLLKNVEIQEKLNKIRKKMLNKQDVNAERVLNEISRIAFGCVADIVTISPKGEVTFKSIDELDDDQKAFISEINSTRTDQSGVVTINTKVKSYDKLKALEMLARYLGMFEKDKDKGIVINVTMDDEGDD